MARDDAQFRLRMPVDLRDYARESAAQNQRSLNGEVVFIIRQHQKSASAAQA